MKTLLLISTLLIGGCSTIIGNTPSLQYCDEVMYYRSGNKMKIQAECSVPMGSSGTPIPVPGGL